MPDADDMIRELQAGAKAEEGDVSLPRPVLMASHAPTMGQLQKVRYTHQDMIDFIIANPTVDLKGLALRYGYSVAWLSNVMASDAWKAAMASRREEIVDPELKATVAERFEALTILSLQRLQEKLAAPMVSDQTVLRAAELGARAMGIGGHAPPAAPAGPSGVDHLAALANRLIDLQSNIRQGVTINGQGTRQDQEAA